jgi:hypothetical protein
MKSVMHFFTVMVRFQSIQAFVFKIALGVLDQKKQQNKTKTIINC